MSKKNSKEQGPPKDSGEASQPASKHKENPIHHFAEEVEEHLLEGAELATSTSSSETNVVLAALGAIEGPPFPKDKAEKKKNGGKRRKARPKSR